MPLFSNRHISPVTDNISLESLPSNLQVQSGHMPAYALAGQLLVSSYSGCTWSAWCSHQPPQPLSWLITTLHTTQQWECPLPPSSPSPSSFPSTSPSELKLLFSSPSQALSKHRRNRPDSFYLRHNSTIFLQAAEFCLPCTTIAYHPINEHPFHTQRAPKSTRDVYSVKVARSVYFLSHFCLVDCWFFDIFQLKSLCPHRELPK